MLIFILLYLTTGMDAFLQSLALLLLLYPVNQIEGTIEWIHTEETHNDTIDTEHRNILLPTHDLTQKELMDFLCSSNAFLMENFPGMSNETRITNQTIGLINITYIAENVMFEMSDNNVVPPIMIAIGIIGNLITILYIPMRKKLRKPFYYCVLNLALGDIMALLFNPYFRKLFLELHPGACTYASFMIVFEIFKQSFDLFSEFGVLILGYVRYLLFVHPFRSIEYLTKSRVLFSFIFSFVFSGLYGYLTVNVLFGSKGLKYIIISTLFDGLSFILLLIILIIFFWNRFQAAQTSVSARDTKLPMTVVTVIILALNALKLAASLANNVRFLIFEYKITKDSDKETSFILVNIVVHSVNPLIYFLKFSSERRKRAACF